MEGTPLGAFSKILRRRGRFAGIRFFRLGLDVIMACQPLGKTVQTGIDDPFVDIELIEHIADTPA